MLARGSSRLQSSYICTSCRCHLLSYTEGQTVAFSTSRSRYARKKVRPTPRADSVSPRNGELKYRVWTPSIGDGEIEDQQKSVNRDGVGASESIPASIPRKDVAKAKRKAEWKISKQSNLASDKISPEPVTKSTSGASLPTKKAATVPKSPKAQGRAADTIKPKKRKGAAADQSRSSDGAHSPENTLPVEVAEEKSRPNARSVKAQAKKDADGVVRAPRKGTMSAARKKAIEAKKSTTPGGLKIIRTPGKLIRFAESKPQMKAEDILEAVRTDSGRQEVTRLIESGKLSPQDTVLAMRALRSKLLRPITPEDLVDQCSEEPISEIKLSARDHRLDDVRAVIEKARKTAMARAKIELKKDKLARRVKNSTAIARKGTATDEDHVKRVSKKSKTVPARDFRPRRSPVAASPPLLPHALAEQEMTIKERMTVHSDNKSKPSRVRPRFERRLIAPGDPAEFKVVKTGPMTITKAQQKKGMDIKEITPESLILKPVDKYDQEPVPALVSGLDRVLFNRGVVDLKDPRSRVYNFDPYLEKITPVSEFNFNALKEYKTSSRDETLLQLTKDTGAKYTGSTSSMSSALAHFHFLLSQWRPITTSMLSRGFPVEFNTFTSLQRGPSAVFLRWRNGAYAIDADKQYDSSTVLMQLGKSMEKLLTLPKQEYEKYLMTNADKFPEEARYEPETFHYSTMGDFLLRSQLDAYDPRLPGTGMFDLKTRACISVRMDTKDWKAASGYEIKNSTGELESYEREYYDMTRAAFLKYSLQVRMGRMDGIFVAFHNTERIFGFQYISLGEMDLALHGTEDTAIGDQEFLASLDLLNETLDKVTTKYPEQSVRLHFETRPGETPFMYIFAEPMSEDQIEEIQNTKKEELMKFDEEVLGIVPKNKVKTLQEKKDAEWENLRAKVEETVQEDEMDIQEIRTLAEDLLEQSEYWDELSPDEKERCIESLVMSATMSDDANGADEASESTLIDDAEGQDDDELMEEDIDSEIDEQDGGKSSGEDEDIYEDDECEAVAEEVTETDSNSVLADPEIFHSEKSSLVDESTTRDVVEDEALLEKSSEEQAEGEDEPILNDNLDQQVEEAAEEIMSDGVNRNGKDGLDHAPISTDGEELMDDTVPSTDDNSTDTSTDERTEKSSNDQTDSDIVDDTDTSSITDGSPEKPSIDALYSLFGAGSAAPEPEEEILPIDTPPKAPVEVLAMTLTIRNKINGEYIARPQSLANGQKWTIEYALDVMDDNKKDRATLLYEACKRRRYESLHYSEDGEQDPMSRNNMFMSQLKQLAKSGRKWRTKTDEEDSEMPIQMLGGNIRPREGGFVGVNGVAKAQESKHENDNDVD